MWYPLKRWLTRQQRLENTNMKSEELHCERFRERSGNGKFEDREIERNNR